MGGIAVDENFAVEGLQNCYAVGECSEAGVHGANRLGGNSLLEIIAFGEEAVKSALSNLKETKNSDYSYSKEEFLDNREGDIKDIYSIHRELGEMLFESAGIIRDEEGLKAGLDKLEELNSRFEKCSVAGFDTTHSESVSDYIEIKNSLSIAEILMKSAIARKESRGAHYRSDYPQSDTKAYSIYVSMSKAELAIEIKRIM